MADAPKATKVLVLQIEVPGVWADDLDACAAEWSDEEDIAESRRLVVTEEWMSENVSLTVLTLSAGEDAEALHAYEGRIVGAEARNV